MPAPTTNPSINPKVGDTSPSTRENPALVLIWSRDEPHRIGETLLFGDPKDAASILGRATPEQAASPERLDFFRQGPGSNTSMGQLVSERLSREHLLIRREGKGLHIQNIGKRAMLFNDETVTNAFVLPGQCIEIKNTILLYCTLRPPVLAPCPSLINAMPRFGEADAFGMVGESPLIWAQREQLAQAASRSEHVLLKGAGGTGAEFGAAAIHAQSGRRDRPFVARNVATFTSEIIEAELFGSAKDHPNPGMPERIGMIGAADGSTLFLDEIGELSHTLQARLGRVLESGEYQRLGDKQSRKADIRLLVATHRPEDELKPDFLARFGLWIELCGLNERPEDIPLLARHLMRKVAASDAAIASRFFEGGRADGQPRFGPVLIRALVTHRYTTHVRQLWSMLWSAILASSGDTIEIELSEGSSEPPGAFTSTVPATPAALLEEVDPAQLSPERIQACLEKTGSVEAAWRALGLRDSFQLLRLMKRYGLRAGG